MRLVKFGARLLSLKRTMSEKTPNPVAGTPFGRWTVTDSTPVRKGRDLYFNLKCTCGNTGLKSKGSLVSGKSSSCGCLHSELLSVRAKTHGMSATPIYAVWNMMRQRCQVPTNKQYKDYGGRGIKVCEKWQNFEGFFEDMGLTPFEGASIERNDTNGDYEKANVRWANREEQNNNTRKTVLYEYKGEKLPSRQLAIKYGINENTLANRLYKYGMTIEAAIETPVMDPRVSGALVGNPVFDTINQRQDGQKKY